MLIHYLYPMDYFMYVYIKKNLKDLSNTRMLLVSLVEIGPSVQENISVNRHCKSCHYYLLKKRPATSFKLTSILITNDVLCQALLGELSKSSVYLLSPLIKGGPLTIKSCCRVC